jgi:4-amino-4-deoxy-L-arabinose transferase-like glycosyltransferase
MKSKSTHLRSIGFWLIFVVIFAFAYLIRASRADWGLPYLYYWDEPQTASTALRILKTGNFNPWFFNYGTLPIYINYFVDVFHYLYLMGQPPTAVAFLTSFADIKTVGDTKWIWTISHPSFYYWNRFTTVIFGTASVWLTFLIARNVFANKWVGLIAALFIASIIPHAQFSALITPDIPMGFFVLATTYFCLRFIDGRQTKYFALALACVGCGFATKYNSILAVLMPALSLVVLYLQERKKFEPKWLIMLPVVPTISFFICMPYAYIDPASFLSGMGFELRHYKILGHGEFTVGAGIRHIRFQAAEILNNIGIIGAAGVVLGLFASIKNPKLLFISIFPLAYFFYMTTTIINFHRNFLVLYPFIAVGYAGAVLVAWRMGNWFATLAGPKMQGTTSSPTASKSVFSILLGVLFVVNVNIMAYWALQDTIKVK